MKEYQASSPGKINLFLDITAKRSNGYHDILTVFLPTLDLADELTLSSAEKLSISTSHPDVPCDANNLCWQAAEKFSEATACLINWHIHIDKKLPVAGGMGGGSSNAATVLTLLNEANDRPLSDAQLAEIALSIGADVPYFLKPVPSLAKGVGEEIETLPTKHKIPLILITFDFPISAVWAYQNRQLPFHSSAKTAAELKNLWGQSKLKLKSFVYNDLAFAARRKFPLLQIAQEDLLAAGGFAEVSGSGPTIFGAFESTESRDLAFESLLKKSYPAANLFKATAG
jgi:4-diphosphocytidyl-2-C-methyl-D-erythritol kinase